MAVLALTVAACAEPRTMPDAQIDECIDCVPRVHARGILDPTSDEWHGRLLARHDWDLRLCQNCHGEAFDGGAAAASCVTCHHEGPATCETCHGVGSLASSSTGAHPPHVASMIGCPECHVTPPTWDAPGHIIDDAPPAEVTFGARANVTPPGAERDGPPSWDGRACSNVYCHGDVTPSFGGIATKPRWADVPSPFTCNRCHGAPPPDHLRVDCIGCHPFTTSEHSNGVVDVY